MNASRYGVISIGVLCGLLVGALWGATFVFPTVLPAFSPWELAVGRYAAYGLIACLAALPVLRKVLRKLNRADCMALASYACIGDILYYVLLGTGVRFAGVGPTTFIIGIIPIVVTVLGRADRGAVPLARLAWPLLMVAVGIVCINIDLFETVSSINRPTWQKVAGMLCAAGALASWSWYAIVNARYLKRNPQYSSTEWSALRGLSSGGIAIALWGAGAIVFPSEATAATFFQTGRDWQLFWLACGCVGLGASLIGNNLWNIASRLLPTTLMGQMIVFETLFGLVYGFVFEGRWPRQLEAAAIVLLIVGVVWSVRLHANGKCA